MSTVSPASQFTAVGGFRRAVLGYSDGTPRGGHLLEAFVWPTMEVIVRDVPEHLRRVHDDETGLALIDPSAT